MGKPISPWKPVTNGNRPFELRCEGSVTRLNLDHGDRRGDPRRRWGDRGDPPHPKRTAQTQRGRIGKWKGNWCICTTSQRKSISTLLNAITHHSKCAGKERSNTRNQTKPPRKRNGLGPVTPDGQGGIPVDVTCPKCDMEPLDHRREQTLTDSRRSLQPRPSIK
jgi:hypothetical protein